MDGNTWFYVFVGVTAFGHLCSGISVTVLAVMHIVRGWAYERRFTEIERRLDQSGAKANSAVSLDGLKLSRDPAVRKTQVAQIARLLSENS